jgi:hypothetical protein
MMKLPVKFPSDSDVIAEEAARYRALPPQDRLQVIRGLIEAGELMLRNSPRAEFLRQYAAEQESAARQAVLEFLARHADKIKSVDD